MSTTSTLEKENEKLRGELVEVTMTLAQAGDELTAYRTTVGQAIKEIQALEIGLAAVDPTQPLYERLKAHVMQVCSAHRVMRARLIELDEKGSEVLELAEKVKTNRMKI